MELFLNIFLFYLIITIHSTFSLKSENYSIIFPFKTILQKDPDLQPTLNLTIMNTIMENILLNDIYIKLELGTPPQTIYLRVTANNDDFYISKGNSYFEEKYSKKNGSFYFDNSKSSTYYYQTEERGHIYFSHNHNSEYVKDNFIFYLTKYKNNNNQICIKNLTFLLAYKVAGPYHGIVGLKGAISDQLRRDDIFRTLKNFDLIKNEIWYLKYDDDNNNRDKNNGSLIIGNYPHYDENIIKKGKNGILKINHFRKVYSTINNQYNSVWGLTFDNIYINNKSVSSNKYEEILTDCDKCKNIVLNPNRGVIVGPTKYKYLLEKAYLNKYLNNKICFQPILKIRINYENKSFYYYYCNASYLEEMRKEFMPIIFEHKEFKYNFSLNFDDLYIQKNNYIFLKIIFPEYQNVNWMFGYPFTSKYFFVFDSISKEIGFYSKNIDDSKDNKNNKKGGNSFIIILKKIIIGIFLILIGILLGKKLFGLRRKLRANELEEKFEYKPVSEKNQLY